MLAQYSPPSAIFLTVFRYDVIGGGFPGTLIGADAEGFLGDIGHPCFSVSTVIQLYRLPERRNASATTGTIEGTLLKSA
jgi:hypothetical protein